MILQRVPALPLRAEVIRRCRLRCQMHAPAAARRVTIALAGVDLRLTGQAMEARKPRQLLGAITTAKPHPDLGQIGSGFDPRSASGRVCAELGGTLTRSRGHSAMASENFTLLASPNERATFGLRLKQWVKQLAY